MKWGRIYQRGRRYWIAYYAPVDGRKKEKREPAGTLEEATALLEKRRLEVLNHRAGVRRFIGPVHERVTLQDLFKDRLARLRVRGRSEDGAKFAFAHAAEFFSGWKASRITGDAILRFVEARQAAGAKPGTIDRELSELRATLRFAVENGKLLFAPVIHNVQRIHANARQGFLSKEDFDAILSNMERPDHRDFFEWSWWTGMRPGESASLTWANYDRDTSSLRLAAKDEKTGRPRVIPIVGPLHAILERRKKQRIPSCRLVFHERGVTMAGSNSGLATRVYAEWYRACKAAGFPGPDDDGHLIPYDLRRTAVRNLRRVVHERVAMEITGHLTRSTFDRYGIVDEQDTREALTRVEQVVRGRLVQFRGHGQKARTGSKK